MPPDAPPPTGLVHRFSLFIERLKRAMADGIRPREDAKAALAGPLWRYLSGTLRRLAALHARFAAGTLAPAAKRGAARQPVSDRPKPVRRPPSIPPGPVLLRYYLVHFVPPLRELLDDPEMRALLAASPRAGRLLRPLWRKLSPRPLPEVLRLPPRPRRPRAKAAAGAPGLRPVVSPDGFIQWEPTPCYPAFSAPPRPNPAPATEAVAPAAAPPPVARPADWGRPAPPARRTAPLPRWLPLLFQR
jgi:hypothetical protein